jgi:hypothetical protein
MHGNYNPNLPTEPPVTSPTPTTTIDKDMQQFYIVVLSIVALTILSISIVALLILAMILIYAMRRP